MKVNAKPWRRLLGAGIVLLCASCFLISASCHYNPTLYPSYDVLNPGPEVRLNPLSFTADGNAVVNQAFILWVYELKAEVIKLRKLKDKK